MKRVLFLAYHFPPVGGAGVQRNAKFARYLPEFGYDSIVVTGPAAGLDRWAPIDATMEGEVPPGTEIRRIPGEPPPSSRWHARAERWLGIRSPWVDWWNENAPKIARDATDVDVIYASLVPYAAAEAATLLARELGKPWVADLQDPWALDEMWVAPTALHRRRDVRRMRRLLGDADAIVMNTSESRNRLLETFPELRHKVVVSIPNGFDAADFSGRAPPERRDGKFRIVHTGYLHTELGLEHRRAGKVRRFVGGAVSGVDIYTRSHVFLLEAIQRLLDERPELAAKIEVRLAGVLSDTDREIGQQYPFVRLLGYVPHAESIELLRSADLLFLPMHDVPPGERISIVPGKTYEYMASGRPILAAVPDGDARDLLTEVETALLCHPSDVAAMHRIVAEQMERTRSDRPAPQPAVDVLARFERRQLTRELAEVFDRLTETVKSGSTRPLLATEAA
jgi:glycosyltransferase involved in cell wall biosynthesis